MDKLMRQIQVLQLEMLKSIIPILNKHNIKYYLSGGSVLGAIRHKGFIPWDDDIDIMIPRFDYDNLEQIFKSELPEKMVFQNYNNCKEFPYIFSRIMRKNTALVFAEVEHLDFHHGIHIDIQPIDMVPHGKAFNRLSKKIHFYKVLLNISYFNEYRKGVKRSFFQRLVIRIVHLTVSKDSIHEAINKTVRKYMNSNVKGIACIGGIYGKREGFPKSILGNGIQCKFEDDFFLIPEDYDFYLTQLYGDYMTYPPEEKRGKHHDVVFRSLTEEYDRNKHRPW